MESLPVRSRMQELNPESWNFKIDLTEHNYLIRDKFQKGEENENQIQNSCLERQRSLAGYSPWGREESDTT